MKVADLASRRQGRPLSPLKHKVLKYLETHPDEVFPYRDSELAAKLKVKVSALSFTLWALHRDGLVDREEVEDKVYFGSQQAVAQLQRKLGKVREDPFEKARELRERIWKRTGNIDVIELLDSVRGPWD